MVLSNVISFRYPPVGGAPYPTGGMPYPHAGPPQGQYPPQAGYPPQGYQAPYPTGPSGNYWQNNVPLDVFINNN